MSDSEKKVVFSISRIQTNELIPQVSQALEKRTEIISRKKYPGMWRQIDKNGAGAAKTMQAGRSNRGLSIVCLLLGVFLLVPGLKEPGTLLVPLIAGGGAVIAGVIGLVGERKNPSPQKRFEQAAKKLLFARGEIKPGQFEVCFSQSGMKVTDLEIDTSESISAALYECLVETADAFLLTYDRNAMVLKKEDITVGSVDVFKELLGCQVSVAEFL